MITLMNGKEPICTLWDAVQPQVGDIIELPPFFGEPMRRIRVTWPATHIVHGKCNSSQWTADVLVPTEPMP